MMMNQGVNTQTVDPADPNLFESRYTHDASQGKASSYLPSSTGSEAASWTVHKVEGHPSQDRMLANGGYQHDQQSEPLVRNIQDGSNATPLTSSSTIGAANAAQDYNSYASYSNSTEPYNYGSAAYPGYYNGYQQQPNSAYSQQQPDNAYTLQQPNDSYSQPVGAYQNTGAAYQPNSSFQNTGSYAGTASYSTTHHNPGNYQTAGGYSSSGYNNQTSVWNNGNYANYTPYQYPNYNSDTSSAYGSGTAATTYQQPYKQWPDYYSQTEVTCAPGTEHLPVASNSNPGSSVPSNCISGGYSTPTNQPQPQPQPQPQFPPPTSFKPTWRPESNPSELPSIQPGGAASGAHDNYWNQPAPTFHTHLATPVQPHYQNSIDSKTSYENFQEQMTAPQGSNSQYPVAHQVSKNYQSTLQNVSSFDTQRVNSLQIPTNPRIASNAAISSAKIDKDRFASSSAPRPAYVSVPVLKPNDKVSSNSAADPMVKPTMFPKSLCGYVERALGRHKDDDARRVACEAVMKEIITKATADGTLYTKDWDSEPLFTLPDSHFINKENLHSSTPATTPDYKKSPIRRSKSRWEPLPEEKMSDVPVSSSNDTVKYGNWNRKAFSGYSATKGNTAFSNFKYSTSQQKTPGKSAQRPIKRQRTVNDTAFTDNDGESSGSDKEQSLTTYYSGAMALANNPDEKKKRESRCKRFEKGQGHRPDINYFKPKNAGPANMLYSRRASALMLSKSFDDSVNEAVEDIDWDALTVKGTCQEIEKRFLRLTSAPDPSTVRPEDVLEKALLMVQNSEKNYLFKCDQLKSIRQDLTVQRIRNQLTVKVYETHARLAMQVGDLAEYNQCQSQLQILYSEGIEGCFMEFAAYNLLCVILHSNNKRDLLSSMSRLTQEAKGDVAVKHALAVIAAVTSGNYVTFFKLYKTAPNLHTCLMDLYVEKMRYKAVVCMSRSYRPTIPILYIAQILGFTGAAEGNGERYLSGFEECLEWLKAHGASLTTDNNEVDAKASSSTLFMPEPEDAVAHGDSSLAVNDFLARTS